MYHEASVLSVLLSCTEGSREIRYFAHSRQQEPKSCVLEVQMLPILFGI